MQNSEVWLVVSCFTGCQENDCFSFPTSKLSSCLSSERRTLWRHFWSYCRVTKRLPSLFCYARWSSSWKWREISRTFFLHTGTLSATGLLLAPKLRPNALSVKNMPYTVAYNREMQNENKHAMMQRLTSELGPINITTLITHHSFTLSFQAWNFPFLQILPIVAFFFRTDSTDSPDFTDAS